MTGSTLRALGAASALLTGLFTTAPAWALCASPGDPDCLAERVDYRGTMDFFATGAAFTIDDDDDDRPDAVRDVAEVFVPDRRVPVSARLVQAFLYFGGSLYDDMDGIDAPDMDVEIQVPGASDFTTVTGEQLYTSGAIAGFPELTLYTVRADITEVMQDAGGAMRGLYRVRGFDADIFDGMAEHTAANASFSIILIFEEERLPPRNIVLFDGMQEVLGSTVTLDLSGFFVSPVPSGALTLYAQEGDCNPGPDACENGNNLAGLERARVIGADPNRTMVLSGPLNPANDLFNRTINTVDPPLRDVTGTDIDTFDITPVLRAGDESVTVEITTPRPANNERGELVGLVYVVVGIDVFSPELRVDSRIEVRSERGDALEAFFPGDPLRVTYALSNTGNLPGTEVGLTTDLPANATDFLVLAEPEGATVTTDRTGGANGRGRVEVTNLAVRHGEVNDLVLLVETECPLPNGGTFAISGDVTPAREGGVPFTLTATVPLVGREICGPRFFLFGGGGCQTTRGGEGRTWWLFVFAGLFVWLVRKTRGAALVLLLALPQYACSDDLDATADRGPPIPAGFTCPGFEGMVIVPSIDGRRPFCIDQYEASVVSGAFESANAVVGSVRFARPARGVTWFQARDACQAAGKRLCTAAEWTTACRGDEDRTFPYGDAYEANTCNGFDARRDDAVETGGMLEASLADDGLLEASGCVSVHGAYDLSGNVWEWNATSYFDDARRGLAGGSFRSNRTGLRCVTDDNHAPPDEDNDAFGFRCCVDFGG